MDQESDQKFFVNVSVFATKQPKSAFTAPISKDPVDDFRYLEFAIFIFRDFRTPKQNSFDAIYLNNT